jgi:hypothetical protein
MCLRVCDCRTLIHALQIFSAILITCFYYQRITKCKNWDYKPELIGDAKMPRILCSIWCTGRSEKIYLKFKIYKNKSCPLTHTIQNVAAVLFVSTASFITLPFLTRATLLPYSIIPIPCRQTDASFPSATSIIICQTIRHHFFLWRALAPQPEGFLCNPNEDDEDEQFFTKLLQLMEHQWNESDRGKPTTQRKTCPSATLSTTNLTWTWPGTEPRASVVRGRRLTAWAMARPYGITYQGTVISFAEF